MRSGLPVGGVFDLEPLHKRYRQCTHEEGIFAVALLSAAPVWITAEIGIGSTRDEVATRVVLSLREAGSMGASF